MAKPCVVVESRAHFDPGEVRVYPCLVPVRALIAAWKRHDQDAHKTALVMAVSDAEMDAALVYYRGHRPEIEVRLNGGS